jgi:hypothetical protein
MSEKTIELENARFFFQNIEDRNKQMISIMHQYSNYVITLLIGMWTAVGAILMSPSAVIHFTILDAPIPFSFRVFVLVIAFNLSFILLLFWRLYIHMIDNDIVSNYPRLIFYENVLLKSVNPNNQDKISVNSIFYCMIKGVPGWEQKIENTIFNWDEKFAIFCFYVNHNKLGSRGQDLFDVLAGAAIKLLLFIEVLMIGIYLITFIGTIHWILYLLEFSIVVGIFIFKYYIFNNIFCQEIEKIKQHKPQERDIQGAICENRAMILLNHPDFEMTTCK